MLSIAAALACRRAPFDTTRSAPFHPSIHNFGNVGWGGWLHARVAHAATRFIDRSAYDGRNMRREFSEALVTRLKKNDDRAPVERLSVVDVGCGVGTLTEELVRANLNVTSALDTSPQMIREARRRLPTLSTVFEVANALDVGGSFDVAVACMLMHEQPHMAHVELLSALADATRDRRGRVVVVDIAPEYKPSMSMLSGEPFVVEYLEGFGATVASSASRENMSLTWWSVIDEHVICYELQHV